MHEQINVDNFLAHYGVKGMKWGVRKKSYQSSTATRLQRGARKLSGNKGGPGVLDPTPKSQAKARYKADKARAKAERAPQLKAASRMKGGEIAVSLILAGPVGVAAYKGIKVARARSDIPLVIPEDSKKRG